MIGVDVARYQGTIDFDKLKKEVDFIIIQAGFGRYASQKDICFDRNYSEAKRTKIPTGAYWFSYAASPEEAKQEAKACLEVLKGKKFEMPIYYDIEGAALSGDVVGKCDAFCSVLEANGYYAGVYISRSPAEQYIKNSRIANKFTYWIAEYPTLHYSGRYDMWQNSSTGNVAGIMDDVDTDYCYKDFPTIIKEGGLNGYEKPKEPSPKPQSPVLDTEGWKYKDHDRGVYLMKQILRKCYFRNLDDNDIMGQGTVNAVNAILKENGYRANGIAGKGFINLITNNLQRK